MLVKSETGNVGGRCPLMSSRRAFRVCVVVGVECVLVGRPSGDAFPKDGRMDQDRLLLLVQMERFSP